MKIAGSIGMLFVLVSTAGAAETGSTRWEGIAAAGLITSKQALVPGDSIHVGFRLKPRPGYHTYWRGPGIVGVATRLQWDLPPGFEAGEILWPPPVKTDMAGILANGYKEETILLTEIQVPEALEADEVTLRVKAAWMACSTSCHPSVDHFSLTLPVAGSGSSTVDAAVARKFRAILKTIPRPAPEDWNFSILEKAEDHLVLEGKIPSLPADAPETLVFFSHDMQVDSNSPSRFEWVEKSEGRFRMHFVRPAYAPKSPMAFSGVLCRTRGWKGLSSSCVEVSIPWSRPDSTDE